MDRLFGRGRASAGAEGLDASAYPPLASGLGPRSTGGNGNGNNGGNGGRASFATGVERFGVRAKAASYLSDPFHSMVSLPTWRFYPLFFAVYLTLYCAFALLYLAFSDDCIRGLEGRFAHALWVASRTAATLGYSELLTPLPTCPAVNLLVMLQVITCSLVNFIMLGLVFARFSAPSKRARSIRFARRAVARRWAPAAGSPAGGAAASSSSPSSSSPEQQPWWCIEVRVANLRKHTLLCPAVRMYAASLDSLDTARFALDELPLEAPERQLLALSLGLSATLTHVVRPSSPLFGLSLAEMEARLFEVLVFVDGTDAMTSRQMQARHAYPAGEDGVLCGQAFVGMQMGLGGGGGGRAGRRLALDFARFDETVPAPSAAATIGGGVVGAAGLRHLTFRRLAEAEGYGGGTAAAAAAGYAGGGATRASAGGNGTVAGAAGAAAAGGSSGGAGLPPKPPVAGGAVEMAAAGPAAAAARPHAPYYTTGSSAGGGAAAAPAPAANPFAPAPRASAATTTTASGGGGGGSTAGGGGTAAGGGGAPAAANASSSFSNVHL